MSDLGHLPGPPPPITSEQEAAALRDLLPAIERALEELSPDHALRPDLGADAIRLRSALAAWDARAR